MYHRVYSARWGFHAFDCAQTPLFPVGESVLVNHVPHK